MKDQIGTTLFENSNDKIGKLWLTLSQSKSNYISEQKKNTCTFCNKKGHLQQICFNYYWKNKTNMNINPGKINFTFPFSGRTEAGKVKINFTKQGTYSLDIPKESVHTNLENLEILTSSANIVVTSE